MNRLRIFFRYFPLMLILHAKKYVIMFGGGYILPQLQPILIERTEGHVQTVLGFLLPYTYNMIWLGLAFMSITVLMCLFSKEESLNYITLRVVLSDEEWQAERERFRKYMMEKR